MPASLVPSPLDFEDPVLLVEVLVWHASSSGIQYANNPDSGQPIVRSQTISGYFGENLPPSELFRRLGRRARISRLPTPPSSAEPFIGAIKIEIDHRRCVE